MIQLLLQPAWMVSKFADVLCSAYIVSSKTSYFFLIGKKETGQLQIQKNHTGWEKMLLQEGIALLYSFIYSHCLVLPVVRYGNNFQYLLYNYVNL